MSECNIVTAYKDLSGTLHLTQGECSRSNEKIRQRRLLDSISNVFSKVIYNNIIKDYRYNRNSLSSDYLVMIMTQDWKQIRDELNAIED